MKFKKFMPVLALACVCAVGQADAARDTLMMPEQPAEPLNVIEAEVAVPVAASVKTDMAAFPPSTSPLWFNFVFAAGFTAVQNGFTQ